MLALALGACSTTGETSVQQEVDHRLESLERNLLNARWIHFGFDIEATGALTADLTGDLWLGRNGEARLQFHGLFQGRPVATEIVSDGTLMRHSHPRIAQKAPPLDLHQAFVIGLTRMGLLHNIAVSFSGRSPDHGMGGVRSWLTLSDVKEATKDLVSFELSVGGKPSATCEIEFAPGEGSLPIARHQEVVFSETAKMQVIEHYFDFSLHQTPPADLFGQ